MHKESEVTKVILIEVGHSLFSSVEILFLPDQLWYNDFDFQC
jgi:hypothetical protein